jgi:hypothetical protein
MYRGSRLHYGLGSLRTLRSNIRLVQQERTCRSFDPRGGGHAAHSSEPRPEKKKEIQRQTVPNKRRRNRKPKTHKLCHAGG